METALQTRGLLSLPPNPRTRALYPSNGLKQRLFAVEPKTLPGFALSSNGFKKYPSFVLKPNGVLPKERNLHICRAAGQPLFSEASNTPKFLGIEVSTLKKYVPLGFPFSLSVSLFSKGCLSMSTIQRAIRRSIICMARRYGSNTRKRKIKSRRRGGDLEKKKKRKRKSTRRKKDKFKIIKLVSAAGTGYVYAKKKGKNMKYKLEIKKYDPEVKHHVLFKETK